MAVGRAHVEFWTKCVSLMCKSHSTEGRSNHRVKRVASRSTDRSEFTDSQAGVSSPKAHSPDMDFVGLSAAPWCRKPQREKMGSPEPFRHPQGEMQSCL